MNLRLNEFEEEINKTVKNFYEKETTSEDDIAEVIFSYSVYADWLEERGENSLGYRWLESKRIFPHEEFDYYLACSGIPFPQLKLGRWTFAPDIIGRKIWNRLSGRIGYFIEASEPILPIREVVRLISYNKYYALDLTGTFELKTWSDGHNI